MTRTPSTSMKIYVLFLFLACIVTSVKLVRIWRAAPPFRLSRQASSPAYLELLETSSSSLKQWIGSTFLGWGIFASITLTDVCSRLLDDKRIGSALILFIIQGVNTFQSGPPITVFDGSTFTLQDLDGINGTNLVYDS